MSASYDDQKMVVCERRVASVKTEDGLNSNWTNDFNASLELKAGDRIAVYNSFISERGAGTPESIEFKQIELQGGKTINYTKTQIIPAGDPRNNTIPGVVPVAESGLRFYENRVYQLAGGSFNTQQPPQVYMDYVDNEDEGVTMRDNEANLVINYYKTMDGLSYFALPRRWAYDDYVDITGATNTNPYQWSDFDSIERGRARSEAVQIADSNGPVGTITTFRNIDKIFGYVRDDYRPVVDSRPDIAYDPVPPTRGQIRRARTEKLILKNDNSRYSILKRKKSLMADQSPATDGNAEAPINPVLMSDFLPPYYAGDPEYHDYVIYKEKIPLSVEAGFSSSKYVSEELTRQLRRLNKDDTLQQERMPFDATNPPADITTEARTLTTIEQFIETATYKRFACSNDYFGSEKFFRETLDNSLPAIAPATAVGFNGPTDLVDDGAGNISFQGGAQKNVITYLQQYQYIGCKRPELYVAGSELNDIFGFKNNTFAPAGSVTNQRFFEENPMELDIPYNEANLLKFKKLFEAQGQHPELFSAENVRNMYEVTVNSLPPLATNTNIYYEVKDPAGTGLQETSFVNINNARYLHMNPQKTEDYNNLLEGDGNLNKGVGELSPWRDFAQLGCSYYDFRGNLITDVDRGTTNNREFSRILNDPINGGKLSEIRYNSLPFYFHYDPTQKDTLYSDTGVADELGSNPNSYTYGCLGRDSLRGNILIFPNKLLDPRPRLGGEIVGVGLPPDFFTEQDGAGNFIIKTGRKVGFDRHFNAWGNACICLTSGIPRFEYKQTLDGTKTLWDTDTQYGWSGPLINAPANNDPVTGVGGIFSDPAVYNNDLQPFLNNAYLGADAPEVVYDGAHFSFKNLHTPLNKGNLNTLTEGDASGDEAQIVYKINPEQSYNNLSPTQLPYEETMDFEYDGTSATETTRRRLNRNLEPFQVYDTTTGIFIEDFGFTQDAWENSLWGRLGFNYEQFHNDNLTERNKRYTDFTSTSNILTTNANVKSSDIKSWSQNKFGESQYTGVLFHPFTFKAYDIPAHQKGHPAQNEKYIEFLPEIIAPTDSVSIVAKDYPTLLSNGFYTIRSDIALNTQSVLGGGDTAFPIVGIADKTNSIKDFFISSPSSITHTITRPITLSSITTTICDPDGSPSRCSPNSIVIYRITRTIDTSFDILGDLERKLQELEQQKTKKK